MAYAARWLMISVAVVWSRPSVATAKPRDLAAALRACDRATMSQPLATRSYRCYASIAGKHGHKRVLPHVHALIRAHPEDPGLLLVRARIHSVMRADAAISDFEAGARGLGTLGRSDPEVKAYVDLARFYFRKNRDSLGEATLRRARKVATAAGDQTLVAIVDISKAMHLLRGDDLEEVRTLAASALARLPEDQQVARSLAMYALTRAHFRMDRLREALDYAQRLSALLRKRGVMYSLAASEELRIGIGFDLRAATHEPDLRPKYVRAIEGLITQAAAAGNLGLVADSLRELYMAVPDARADEVLTRARAAASRIDDTALLLRLRWAKVDRSVSAGDFDLAVALTELEHIATAGRTRKDAWMVLDTMFTTAVALWTKGERDRAWDAFQRAFAAIEAERDVQPSKGAGRGVFARRVAQYNAAAGRMLRHAGWEKRAFQVTERARARQLLAMRRAYAGTRAPGIRAPTVADLQRLLAPDEALVSFFVGPGAEGHRSGIWWGASGVFVITARGFASYALPAESLLVPAVDTFVGGIRARDGSDERIGPRLYQLLLASAMRSLPTDVKRIVIVGDGALHRLPFSALRPTAAAQPLGTRFEFSYAPSATLWHELRSRPRAALARAVLALANPTLDRAPVVANAVGFRSGSLRPLPGAVAEGGWAVRRVGGRSALRIGSDATESYLKSEHARAFSIYHIAAHAVLNARHPERSALLLARSTADDGRMDLEEFARLDLRDRVVVLAACDSADGNLVGGEGPISLARAGFVAGSRAVLASLWPLRDDEALALFKAFYGHLDRGLSLRASLAAAQRDRMRDGAPTAAWAGVVLMGDSTPHLVPGSVRSSPWWQRRVIGAALAGFLVLGLGAIVSVIRRFR